MDRFFPYHEVKPSSNWTDDTLRIDEKRMTSSATRLSRDARPSRELVLEEFGYDRYEGNEDDDDAQGA